MFIDRHSNWKEGVFDDHYSRLTFVTNFSFLDPLHHTPHTFTHLHTTFPVLEALFRRASSRRICIKPDIDASDITDQESETGRIKPQTPTPLLVYFSMLLESVLTTTEPGQ